MFRSLLARLDPAGEIVRGRPHFDSPRPGVVAWIAEGRRVQRAGCPVVIPTAIIELHAAGVRRRPLRRGLPAWVVVLAPVLLVALVLCRRYRR